MKRIIMIAGHFLAILFFICILILFGYSINFYLTHEEMKVLSQEELKSLHNDLQIVQENVSGFINEVSTELESEIKTYTFTIENDKATLVSKITVGKDTPFENYIIYNKDTKMQMIIKVIIFIMVEIIVASCIIIHVKKICKKCKRKILKNNKNFLID